MEIICREGLRLLEAPIFGFAPNWPVNVSQDGYMKVFLSWSGHLSKLVAEELRQWLPNVIQALEPWLSSEDIGKGARWSAHVASELVASKAGIICVTADNHAAPWLNFEAGAISNSVGPAMVCTLLIGMKPTDLSGPLTQFQATVISEPDIKRLVVSLNKALEKDALPEKKLDEAFEVWWPRLKTALSSLQLPAEPERTDREIAEEMLTIVRELARRPVNPLFQSGIYASDSGPFIDPNSKSYLPWREAASGLSDPRFGVYTLDDISKRAIASTNKADPEPPGQTKSNPT